MIVFRFTKTAEKAFVKFDPKVREYLLEGLWFLKNPIVLESASKPVTDLLPATHRLRIGNYRALYRRDDDTVTVLKIGHRKDIYR